MEKEKQDNLRAKRPPLKREYRSRLVSFKLRPSIYTAARKVAYVKYDTLNNYVNTMLESYVRDNQDALEEYAALFPHGNSPLDDEEQKI